MGRTAVACDLCRDKKRKCDGQRPICESCRTYGLLCGYGRVIHSKRGKYWDQKYVQSLENQVRILSTSAGIGRNDGNDESAGTVKYGGAEMENSNHHRSPKALNDFTSLVWPISPGSNDEPLFVGPGFFNIPFGKSLPAFETPDLQPPSEAAVTIVQIAQDTELKEHLKQIFLETINPYYNFVEESWLQFSGLFPENDPALQFLYSAVFGIAAHCSPRTMHGEAECLIDYAESLVLECCRDHPCISVLRGLLIMSCYKHAILESSQGLVYNYMAIGLSSTLHVGQIHRLPAERAKPLDNIAREASVRTLWSLLFVNGYGTPALGASFRMFWDVSETPSYLSTLPADVTNTTAVAFESHCKLRKKVSF
ncbi:Zn(2)-C6 fungal-type domain-containing protein [Apiospora arundinis]|uniref:Zn(2)-C6 fungal-type domain-containing protein n=1 Tax=Apiospora arundinis TaxID=335852 RepID=A0ABR2IX10_9PEZI